MSDTFEKQVFEIHDIVGRIDQKLTDHLKWSESVHEKRESEIKDISLRIGSLEGLRDKISLLKWPVTVVLVPSLMALGTYLWHTVRDLIKKG